MRTPARRFLASAAAACVLCGPAAAQKAPDGKRKELNRIQTELQETRQDIEKLRKQESGLHRDLGRLEAQTEASRARLSTIQGNLARAQDKTRALRTKLSALRTAQSLWRAMLADEASDYVVERAGREDAFGSRSIWREALRRAAIIEKAGLLAGLGGVASKTARLQSEVQVQERSLSEKKAEALAAKAQTEAAYQGKKAEMEGLRSLTQAALDRLAELEESAKALRNMLDSISKLQRTAKSSGGTLPIAKHSLPWPCPGRVVSNYGKERDAKSGSWVINQGVKIEPPASSPVAAVAAGRVIFAGPFRSYGQVVILDHGGYFSVYGDLGAILKGKAAQVSAGEQIGRAGGRGSAGRLYFEIRLGSEALDPLAWLEKR